MDFSSSYFLYLFLPILLFLHFLVKSEYRNGLLLISSLFFYAWGEPRLVSLLIFSAIIDYFHGRVAEKYRGSWQSKAALISSIIVNLSLLAVCKYSEFLFQNLNQLTGWNIHFVIVDHLPIGISFYTFQTISYVIDVYRGDVEAQKSPFKFLMFVSLFHQLVAGPIVRYKDIASEIENRVVNIICM